MVTLDSPMSDVNLNGTISCASDFRFVVAPISSFWCALATAYDTRLPMSSPTSDRSIKEGST